MTGQDIINRAISLADLTNATFITAADQLNSLQESYNDVHHILIDDDNDYFLNEAVSTVSGAMAAPNGVPGEYLVPMPTDMFKLRYVDYAGNGGQWVRLAKFNLGIKNMVVGQPYYRMKNQNLWLIGMGTSGTLTVKIGYYPPPMTVTLLSVFDYPLNSVPEMMSYQIAMDFLSKQGTPDETRMNYLSNRYSMLHTRFIDEAKRDQYQPERIKNMYDNSQSLWGN